MTQPTTPTPAPFSLTSPTGPAPSSTPAPSVSVPEPVVGARLQEEGARPGRVVALLLSLVVTVLVSVGLFTWLTRRSPAPLEEKARLAAQEAPAPVVAPGPPVLVEAVNVRPPLKVSVPPGRLAPVEPLRKAVRRADAPLVEAPIVSTPAFAPKVSLTGKGDVGSVQIQVLRLSRRGEVLDLFGKEAKLRAPGVLVVPLERLAPYIWTVSAPGYVSQSGHLTISSEDQVERPRVILERPKTFEVEVAQFAVGGEPPALQRLKVQSDDAWEEVHFEQEKGVLHARVRRCVCIAHHLGKVPDAELGSITVPDARGERCFFALLVGETHLVQTQPGSPWLVVRLAGETG